MLNNSYDKCAYPDCEGNIVPGKTCNGLCIKHSDLLQFFLWTLDNVIVVNKEQGNSEK